MSETTSSLYLTLGRDGGEPYALTFAGQATPWQQTLADETESPLVAEAVRDLIKAGSEINAKLARELTVQAGDLPDLRSLLRADGTDTSASVPGILAAQYAALCALAEEGFDTRIQRPLRVVGHSQGALGAALYEAWVQGDKRRMAEVFALAQLLGVATTVATRQLDFRPQGPKTPMLAVQSVRRSDVELLLQESGLDGRVSISLVNGANQVVLSGAPTDLEAFVRAGENRRLTEEENIGNKVRGGLPFSPVFTYLAVGAPFHSPLLEDALESVKKWSDIVGLDSDLTQRLATEILVTPVDWQQTTADFVDAGIQWAVDIGPGTTLSRITANTLLGSDIGSVSVGTAEEKDQFFTPGNTYAKPTSWSEFAPKVAALSASDGETMRAVETKFTRLTGRSPILLAGMTPTTVDPEIVAAAANAGHWAELAGGGQVTEEVFAENLAKLKELLDPGQAAQFNAMYLDPYLWNLQFGNQNIVPKARASGAPLDGVTVSAGIPELDEATELLRRLQAEGFPYVAFKPGTVAQIRQVIDIAHASPDLPVIIQVEDGHAGGHHSWENLDDLLLATYADIRATENLVLVVGGGIGTPERAADYISGQWSEVHGQPPMPVDGVLVGTAAMTALEAKTTDEVKRLLVDTPGVQTAPAEDPAGGWVATQEVRGGVTSGISHLRADIHEVENAAAACARLVYEVSGDEEAIRARRDEIVDALNKTAKPYFGDVDQMTYLEWARRFAELSHPWVDDTWINRFQLLLQRAEARLNPEQTGTIVSLFPTVEEVQEPYEALSLLEDTYPNAADTLVTPTDAAWFVDLVRKYPKPMPFVPVLDTDLLRWWGQDNLWQSQDPRYSADEVRIIPGPISVAGIDQVDEPIGQLLGRFEAACVERLETSGGETVQRYARKGGAQDVGELLRLTPYISWNENLVDNPVRVVSPESLTVLSDSSTGTHDLVISLDTSWDGNQDADDFHAVRKLVVTLGAPDGAENGAYPVVDRVALPGNMYELLSSTAGVGGKTITGDAIDRLPEMVPSADSTFGEAHWTFTVTGSLADMHRGATGEALPALFHLDKWTPDALLGLCWPAIYAALGSALVDDYPVIEGLLSAVHLDHTAQIDVDLNELLSGEETQLTVVASTTDVSESSAGRVVTVNETLYHDGEPIGRFQERFAIRGRVFSDRPPLEVPVAAGEPSEVIDTPRSVLRQATVTAPADMTAFANVSGDFNPIHTSYEAASVAGLEAPLVHGMWLSAVAQNLVQADDSDGLGHRITGWTYNMYGLVNLNDDIDLTVERVGRLPGGGLLLEVTAKIAGQIVSRATASTAPPTTAYVYPGQGIQQKGMTLEEIAESAAVQEVWERADALTKDKLGFSILTVVRENPTELEVRGRKLRHPDGLLHLTQFTQVALATVAFAQTARLREIGALVEDAYFAGHSLGEYNALSAYGQVFPLETVLEIVFHRGSTMHHLVERDSEGRSNYRMGALRPNQFGMGDDQVIDYVRSVAAEAGEFLQIVNFNLAGEQYAVAGTKAGLEALEKDANDRAEAAGGKPPFMYVPGVDVPFHSDVLRNGVGEFRQKLDDLLPPVIPAQRLIHRYIPNLVAVPFEPTKQFARTILNQVPSQPVEDLLADEDAWAAEKLDKTARTLLVELLAWQFASPVRWIETQQLMFTSENRGGLGVNRMVEVGLASAPTLAGLAARTLSSDMFAEEVVEALNVQRDSQVVTWSDVRAAAFEPAEDNADESPAHQEDEAPESAEDPQVRHEPAPQAPSSQESTSVGPAPDITFTAADAIRVVMAYTNKLAPEQIENSDTTETLTSGASARRNQLLMDLSAELGLPSIDGAADASIEELEASVNDLARHYKAFGPVLTEAIRDRLRRVFGSASVPTSFAADRVKDVWQLGQGWVDAVTAEILLGTRDGESARGGALASLSTSVNSRAEAEAIVDQAVDQVGKARGVDVAIPSAGGSSSVVDSAALDEYAETVTGQKGALAETAHHLLRVLGLEGPQTLPTGTAGEEDVRADEHAARTLEAELGPRWVQSVEPSFEATKAILFDDRWASAREDLARLWEKPVGEGPNIATFAGAGRAVADQASWWVDRAKRESRSDHAKTYEAISRAARTTPDLPFTGQVAVVTGVTPTSIAGAVAARLLAGGATVIATSSKIDPGRLDFAKRLYRENAAGDAALWLVPANLSSYRDVDALVDWIGSEQARTVGPERVVDKPALVPDLFFPFAAPPVLGSLADSGELFEAQARLLLWSVERSIAGLASIVDRSPETKRLHVVLPGSPNRGLFGGDGAYGEVKAAFDAIANRWASEEVWAKNTTIAHPKIGWVQGTGLMGGNDPLMPAARKAGIRTFTTDEIADELISLVSSEARQEALSGPLEADLTGGLSRSVDFSALKKAAEAAEDIVEEAASPDGQALISALPSPTRVNLAEVDVEDWDKVTVSPEEMVVIVGVGEVGPWGSARTRWEAELGVGPDGEVDLTPAGVLELAWLTGLVNWEDSPESGWYDLDGQLVDPADVYDRYRDEVVARSGIRSFIDDAGIEGLGSLEAASVFLTEDVSFTVPDQETAESYVLEDERLTRIRQLPDGEWEVTRLAGAEARLPRRATLTRTVGGQFPTGFDPTKWGLTPAMLEGMDRIAAWNLVSAVDGFLSSGFTPAELLQAVHPADVGSTQGTGFGGMTSMRKLFVDRFLGEDYPQDVLQETLPNVVAAHAMQSFVGGYGPMVQPVSACATAAISIEEGVDKIQTGKAKFVVAGATDDLSVESVVGFGSMNATANSEEMAGKGIDERFYSRANDRRRGGFIESQGGGTVLLARGDVAAEMGLPVLGVVGYAQSFADGIHTSIPAPGLGALAAGRGGTQSRLMRSLRNFGLDADDVRFVSKHDTSTNANDPNESELHTRLAEALGRTAGNPLFVVSQKSVTGHSKGGAAVFQVSGITQAFRDGVLPGNMALDCVDRQLETNPHLVWLRSPLTVGHIPAAILTSLGFGHVSSLIALIHPGAFEGALLADGGEEAHQAWRAAASRRLAKGARTLESGMLGRSELFLPVDDRRLTGRDAEETREAEAAMLLDEDARLAADGRYVAANAEG